MLPESLTSHDSSIAGLPHLAELEARVAQGFRIGASGRGVSKI